MNKPTLTKELIDAIRAEIFRKPEWEAVAEEMRGLLNGKRRTMHRISRLYFYDERTKARGMNGRPFYSVMENDEDFRKAYELAWRYLSCDYDEAKPIESMAAMMAGFGRLFRAYHIPSMFPFKRAKEIMERYNTNGKVFDYSCGWGNRLCAALSLGPDYYGVDTNPDLVEILNRFAEDFNTATGQATPHEIRF